MMMIDTLIDLKEEVKYDIKQAEILNETKWTEERAERVEHMKNVVYHLEQAINELEGNE